jgi:hypothetical protein
MCCRRSVLSTKCSVDEMCCRRSILSTKCSVDEVSCRRNALRRSVVSTKCCVDKKFVDQLPVDKILSTNNIFTQYQYQMVLGGIGIVTSLNKSRSSDIFNIPLQCVWHTLCRFLCKRMCFHEALY